MARAHPPRQLAGAVAFVAALLPWAGPLAAQDHAAPSLRVDTDAGVPVRTFAVSVDPVAAFLGTYGVEVEIAAADAHSLRVLPQLEFGGADDALTFEVGYHLWPLSRGLEGPFVGPAAAVSVTSPGRSVRVRGVLEVGYQLVWDGVVVGACLGLAARSDLASQPAARLLPRVRLVLGYAWF